MRWTFCVSLRNVQDFFQQMGNLWGRHDTPCRGPMIPLGAKISKHPISTNGKLKFHQFISTSLQRHVYWICLERAERLDGRPTHGRCGEIERQGCIRSQRQKIQRQRVGDPKSGRTIHISLCWRFKKKTEDGPNRHTTNPSRSCSNLVVDVSGCLLGEENDASDLAKEQKDAWEASKASREDHVMNRETSSVHRKESFLILTNCIDVDRQTYDYWNVDGERPLSGSWIGFTRFKILKKPPPDGHVERRNTNTHANNVQVWCHLARSFVENVKTLKTRSKTTMGYKNIKVRRGIAYIATDDHVFDTFTKTARSKLETHVESAILCKAQRNFEKKTLVHPMSTSREELCVQMHFMLTKLMLTNLEDAVSTKAADKSTKSILQTVYIILRFFTTWFICRYPFQSNDNFGWKGGSGQRDGANWKMPAWQEFKVRKTSSRKHKQKCKNECILQRLWTHALPKKKRFGQKILKYTGRTSYCVVMQ